MPDLNANDIEQAAKIIEGTARSMGVEVQLMAQARQALPGQLRVHRPRQGL